jgi:hypothetical protein
MCSPAISIGLQVVGAVTSFLGARQEGQQQQNQANYQAAIARNNAQIAQNNKITALRLAEDARKRGEAEAQTFSERVRRLQGTQRATLAANGVLVDSGSALDITQETAETGQLDALTIRSNAEREALGFQNQAVNFEAQSINQQAQANLNVMAGNNAVASANRRGLSSLLTGAGSVASKWNTFNQAGVSVF